MKINKLMVIILLLFLLSANILSAKQKVIIYGDKNYPPYSYEEDGKAKGIYVDILKLAFSKIAEYDLIIKMVPWKRGLSYVRNGKCIALFPPYYTEKRDPWMIFSEPILKEKVVVFGKSKNLKGKEKWPEDFYGCTIALNRGFGLYALGGEKFGDACKDGKILIKEEDTNEKNLKKLEFGRVDYYLNDKMIDTSKYPSVKKGIVATSNHGHLGFTKKSKKYTFISDLIIKFNKRIKEIQKTKKIEEIVEKYVKRIKGRIK